MKNNLLAQARAFAAEHPVRPGPACWVCSLPKDLREAIEVLRLEDGLSIRAITDWLTAPKPKGAACDPMEATRYRLKHHFEANHHIPKGQPK